MMIDVVMGIVGQIFYPMFAYIFVLIDLIQAVFYGFAGLGTIRMGGIRWNTNGATIVPEGDDAGIIYYLFQSELIKNLLISIMVLALVLLVIFTILAFLKNMYAAKPKKWQDIIGDSIKALGLFIAVPVLCLLGVWVGNIVLRAINDATNPGSSDSLSGMLFQVSAYNANRIRTGSKVLEEWGHYEALIDELNQYNANNPNDKIEFKENVKDESGKYDVEYYADIVDQLYSSEGYGVQRTWWSTVEHWYNLSQINYLVLVGGGIFMLYALCAISFGMIKRMFMLLVLYVISPVMVAMYPIKGDGPLKSWSGDFVKQAISAYGAVAGMNIMFALLPLVQAIDIVGVPDVFGLLPLLTTIAGLYMVKDIIALISGYIGADNAYSAGVGLMGSVQGRVKKTSKSFTSGVKGTVGAFTRANMAADKAKAEGRSGFGAKVGSLAGSTLRGMNTLANNTMGLDIGDVIKNGTKDGKKAFEEDEKNKKYVDYTKAKKDAKSAEEDVTNLTSDNNKELLRLSKNHIWNTADGKTMLGGSGGLKNLRQRAMNGDYYTQEDIDNASGERKKQLQDTNAYIQEVQDAQKRQRKAEQIIEVYEEPVKLAEDQKKYDAINKKPEDERTQEEKKFKTDYENRNKLPDAVEIKATKVNVDGNQEQDKKPASNQNGDQNKEDKKDNNEESSDTDVSQELIDAINTAMSGGNDKIVDALKNVIESLKESGNKTVEELSKVLEQLKDLKSKTTEGTDMNRKIENAINQINDEIKKANKKKNKDE